MENPRPEKVAVVDEVRERFESTDAALLTEYRGINVAAMAELRRSIRAAGGDYKIYKNTLVRFATRDLGLELEDQLTGPTAIAFITTRPDGSKGDAVTVAKALRDFARTNPNLVVKGGILGTRVLSEADARALADVAPREELLARLAGGLAAPMQKFAGLLQALPRNFAYGLKALIDQGGAPGAPAAEPEHAPAADTAAPATDDAPAEPAGADAAPDVEASATEPETRPDENPEPAPAEQEPAEGGAEAASPETDPTEN
jgi:large subunit ribosomal protein L10